MNPRAVNLLLGLARAGAVGDVLLKMPQEDADALLSAHIAVCRVVHPKPRRYWRLVEWLGLPTWLESEGVEERLFMVRHRAPRPPATPPVNDTEGFVFQQQARLGLSVGRLVEVFFDDEDHDAEGRVIRPRIVEVPPPGYPSSGNRDFEARRHIERAWVEVDRLPTTQANRDWGERRRARAEEVFESRALFPFRRKDA